MRTFSAPAWIVRQQSLRTKRFWFFAAAFEMVIFDKMPFVPDRTTPPQLIMRGASGAACAAYANQTEQRRFDRIEAAITGGVAAVVAAYAMVKLRRRAGVRLGLPDPVLGIAEDAMSMGLGKLLTGRRPPALHGGRRKVFW